MKASDASCGRSVSVKNTLVVFTSDNAGTGVTTNAPAGASTLYEGGLRAALCAACDKPKATPIITVDYTTFRFCGRARDRRQAVDGVSITLFKGNGRLARYSHWHARFAAFSRRFHWRDSPRRL